MRAIDGLVNGVDYLLLGKVTNFRIKAEDKSSGVAAGGGQGIFKSLTKSIGDVGYEKNDVKITTECGVDIRLVDPTTGEVLLSNFSEYKKTDEAGVLEQAEVARHRTGAHTVILHHSKVQ